MPRLVKRIALIGGALVVLLFVVIQVIPFGRPVPDPPIRVEPRWDSPRTRDLAARACFDCHSNQTTYPWYSYVAPVSWLIQDDVRQGRSKLNFSEWDLPQREAQNASRELQRGDMPLPIYLPIHPQAQLSAEEKQALIDGLKTTIASDTPRRR